MKRNALIKLSIIFSVCFLVTVVFCIVFAVNNGFKCYDCKNTCNGVPNQITLYGEKRDLCDTCYKHWKEFINELKSEENKTPSVWETIDQAEETIDAQIVDIFSEINVKFTGISGEGILTIDYLPNAAFAKNIDFKKSSQCNLSNGEEITVSITDYEQNILLRDYNVIPKETSKTYTVEGLSEYVASADQFPPELIDQYAARFLAEEEPEDDFLFSYTEPKLYGVYFMTPKTEEIGLRKNILKFVVYYDEYMQGEYRRTIYIPLDFYNIEIDRKGCVGLSYSDGCGGTFTTDIDDHLAKHDDYNIEKINLIQ